MSKQRQIAKLENSNMVEAMEEMRSDSSVEIKQLAEELKPLLPEDARLIIDECVEQYERNDIVVMVAGEVSVGKSSLLNALIGRPVLLTDLTETTAAITYLRCADGDRTAKVNMAKVTYNDGRIEWLDLKAKSLMKVTTSLQNDDALHKVKKVDIYLPSEIIPRGITIVDTPGLNGGDKHSALTHREMGLCHAALLLLDASKAGTLSEKGELNKLYDYAPIVFFVLTKWDQVRKANSQLTMDGIKKRYLESIGKITHDISNVKAISAENIYVVSAKEGLEARQNLDKYLNNQQSKRADKEINVREFLPDKGKNNEIFDLFIDLIEKLGSENKNRMIRLRPLLTMSNLAKNTLESIEAQNKQKSDTSELDKKISSLTLELEKRKNLMIERNREVVERIVAIAEGEQRELLDMIEASKEKVVSEMTQAVKTTHAFRNKRVDVLMSTEYHAKLKEKLDSVLLEEILKPLQGTVNDFLTLVNNSFETGEKLTVDMPGQVVPESDFSRITKQKEKMLQNIDELKDGEEAILKEISELETKYDSLTNEYKECVEAKKKVHAFDNQIENIDKQLKAMGNRPGADQD